MMGVMRIADDPVVQASAPLTGLDAISVCLPFCWRAAWRAVGETL
jgi:hypothetical protein